MMTPTPFERLASFDRLVHEPARLAILTALSACEKADFVFLRSLTRLTKGNLSSHLSKLEHAGLVSLEKMFEGQQAHHIRQSHRRGARRAQGLLEEIRRGPKRSRDWPWRAYYLLVPAAVALAFTATASGGGTLNPDLTLCVLFVTLGVSMAAVGLLDHLLLVKLTNESRALAGGGEGIGSFQNGGMG